MVRYWDDLRESLQVMKYTPQPESLIPILAQEPIVGETEVGNPVGLSRTFVEVVGGLWGTVV